MEVVTMNKSNEAKKDKVDLVEIGERIQKTGLNLIMLGIGLFMMVFGYIVLKVLWGLR